MILRLFGFILISENGNLQEFQDKVTWMEAVSKCAKQNQTLAYYLPFSDKYNSFNQRSSYFWIGIRQFYQIETVKRRCFFQELIHVPYFVEVKQNECIKEDWYRVSVGVF